jgi:hypothetical protein
MHQWFGNLESVLGFDVELTTISFPTIAGNVTPDDDGVLTASTDTTDVTVYLQPRSLTTDELNHFFPGVGQNYIALEGWLGTQEMPRFPDEVREMGMPIGTCVYDGRNCSIRIGIKGTHFADSMVGERFVAVVIPAGLE